MLYFLITYAVPLNLVLLMLVAGTEIRRSDLYDLFNPKMVAPILTAAIGQLLLVPVVALVVISLLQPSPVVGAALMILSMCPGGGISNTYCYLAKCSVFLSASITTTANVFCLLTIPIWLEALSYLHVEQPLAATSPGAILLPLAIFMIAPLSLGALAREKRPHLVEWAGNTLRVLSLSLVVCILAVATATVASEFRTNITDIASTAVLFILFAMALGALLGLPFGDDARHVITIESCVRNIPVALMLGTVILKTEDFPMMATFLSGYLAAEIVIMLGYAAWVARSRTASIVRP